MCGASFALHFVICLLLGNTNAATRMPYTRPLGLVLTMMVIMIYVMPICYNDIDIYDDASDDSQWCRYDICNNDIDINVMLQRVTNYFGTLLPDVIPGLTIYNILTDCSPVQISSSSPSPSITQSLIFNMISVVQPCKSSRALFFFFLQSSLLSSTCRAYILKANVLFSPEWLAEQNK